MPNITTLPTRPLGKTGHHVTLFALGGEGVLRTHGRMREAVAVIERALDVGVNYCDTAPAYDQSLDYYGEALGGRRSQIFLASKTHDRTRDGSLRLLDESLRRLRTDHLDLWQLHDLRTPGDLETIFAKGGALEALVQDRAEGRVRFLGITGHHDPAILMEALRRFEFDNVLVALNAADIHRLPFQQTVLPEAARRGMGVVAMKVYGAGTILPTRSSRNSPECGDVPTGPPRSGERRLHGLLPAEALGYVLSLPGVSTAVIGCQTPTEVDENARIAREFAVFNTTQQRDLEQRTLANAGLITRYKRAAP